MDLASHEGGNLMGDFAQTLTTIDVCPGWIEIQVWRYKAQTWVFEAINIISFRKLSEAIGNY